MSGQEIRHKNRLTDGGLAKLLISDLIGNVGPHQHTHGDTKLLLDHIGDEFKSIRPLVYTLEEQKHIHKWCIYIKTYKAGICVRDHTGKLAYSCSNMAIDCISLASQFRDKRWTIHGRL